MSLSAKVSYTSLVLLVLSSLGTIACLAVITVYLSYLTPDKASPVAVIIALTLLTIASTIAAAINYCKKYKAQSVSILIDNARSIAAGKKPAQSLPASDELSELQVIYTKMYSSINRLRQRERAILDFAADGICSLDSNLRFVNVNHSLVSMLESSQEHLIGSRLASLLDEGALDIATKSFSKAQTELETIRFMVDVHIQQGCAKLSWSVVFDPDKQEYYCLVQDITSQAKLEQLKNEFVSMVSHDLRTPLASIELAHGLLSSEDLSAEAQDTLSIAQGSVKRLMALVNNLLDLDKLEAGSMSIHQAQKYLLPLVQGCVDALSLLAQQKQLTVQIQIDPTIAAYMDEERINQVLINILSNAFKYSPRGKTVTVSAFRQNQIIRVEITDQGPGVPPEMLSAVFERFKQVNKSDKATGTGLGLAICKAIIERHGGQIAVESQSGNGSTFWFTLPINPDALETNAS